MKNNRPLINHLYLQFPFSCNNVLSEKEKDNLWNKLFKEIKQFLVEYAYNLKTIYFGGFCFSFLQEPGINYFWNLIEKLSYKEAQQFTIENSCFCVKQGHFLVLSNYGVNRVVWRVKSSLSKQKMDSIKLAKEDGFKDFSIDLVYTNKTSHKTIKKNLNICDELSSTHISYESINNQINEELVSLIDKTLTNKGYFKYEAFSYVKNKKYISYQTIAYLKLENWYGIGANATSFYQFNNQKIIRKNSKNWKPNYQTISEIEYEELLKLK